VTLVKVLEDEMKRQKKKKLKEREKHRMTKTLLQETEEVLELAQAKNLELVERLRLLTRFVEESTSI